MVLERAGGSREKPVEGFEDPANARLAIGGGLGRFITVRYHQIIASRPVLLVLLAALIAFAGVSSRLSISTTSACWPTRPCNRLRARGSSAPAANAAARVLHLLGQLPARRAEPGRIPRSEPALHLAVVWLLFDCLRKLLEGRAALAARRSSRPPDTSRGGELRVRAAHSAGRPVLSAGPSSLTGKRHWLAVAWFVPALLAKEECVAFRCFS